MRNDSISPRPQARRVAIVLEHFDRNVGGLENWSYQFVKALLGRGYEVHVAAAAFASTDLPIIAHPFRREASPWAQALRVEETLRPLAVDIVHDTGLGWSADVLHPHAGSRVLNLERDLGSLSLAQRARRILSPAFRRWRQDLAATEKRQMSTANCVVSVSEMVKRDLVGRYRLPADTTVVVPNGIDTARFSPAARNQHRTAARRDLGVADEVMFLAAARNFGLKGLDTCLRAIGRLRRNGRNFRLVVAGDGAISEYRRKAERLGIGELVSFLGHVDAIERIYAAADVFVHPTFHDACSLVTLEALASGLPVITTSVNGAAAGMNFGREGYVLESAKDSRALAVAMQELLDPDKRRACGDAALRLGRAYSFAANCEGIIAVYDAVLRSRGRAAGICQ
jgi:glycosyltransferase involved in cell wall biosynthesis